ncbi:MAG TPA: hypothetical protein VM263_03315, partial [Acidimicrobiales bacterium]|nr:hypothetical protein [Acidimicrobiales bacterium]
MVRRSFRVGLRVGLLVGLLAAVVKIVLVRRSSRGEAPPDVPSWPPVSPEAVAVEQAGPTVPDRI